MSNNQDKNGISVKKYSGVYHEMVEAYGEKVTLKIYHDYKGQYVRFPMKLYSKEYVNEYLKIHYDGSNLKSLAMELNYSERHIQRLIKGITQEEIERESYIKEEPDMMP